MSPRDGASLCVLGASAHALSWNALPPGMQGSWLNVSQLALVLGMAVLVWACATARQPLQAADRTAVAAALAVVVADNTVNAACSGAWLIAPWVPEPGQDLCSTKWGVPVALVTASAYALLVAYLSKKPGKKT